MAISPVCACFQAIVRLARWKTGTAEWMAWLSAVGFTDQANEGVMAHSCWTDPKCQHNYQYPLRIRCSFRNADADVAREKQLEAELRGLEEKLSEEVDLRAKEALDFANRLKEVNILLFSHFRIVDMNLLIERHTTFGGQSTWN